MRHGPDLAEAVAGEHTSQEVLVVEIVVEYQRGEGDRQGDHPGEDDRYLYEG